MNLIYFEDLIFNLNNPFGCWILCLQCHKKIPRIRIFDYNKEIMISMNCDCTAKTLIMLLDEYLEICNQEKMDNLHTKDIYCIQCAKFLTPEKRKVHDKTIFSVNHIIVNREIIIQYSCQSSLHKNQKILAKYYSLDTYQLLCKECATNSEKCRKLTSLRSETIEIIQCLNSFDEETFDNLKNQQSITYIINILRYMFELITKVNMPDLNLSFSICNIFHYLDTKKYSLSFPSNIEFGIILSPDIPIEPLSEGNGIIPYINPTSSGMALIGFDIAQPQLLKYDETVCNLIPNSLSSPFYHLIGYPTSPNKFLGLTKSKTNEYSFSSLEIKRNDEPTLGRHSFFLEEEKLTNQNCTIKNEINCICFINNETFATGGKSINVWEIKEKNIYLRASINNNGQIITNSIIYVNYFTNLRRNNSFRRSLTFNIENKLICGNNDGQIQLIELKDSELFFQKTKKLHSKQITCLRKMTNKRFASGGDDGKIAIYYQENIKEIIYLYGHKGPIVNIEVFKNTNEIISAGKDKQIIIWDVESRCKLKVFNPNSINGIENIYDVDSFSLFKGEKDYCFFVALSLKEIQYGGFQNIIEIWKSKNFDTYLEDNKQ